MVDPLVVVHVSMIQLLNMVIAPTLVVVFIAHTASQKRGQLVRHQKLNVRSAVISIL